MIVEWWWHNWDVNRADAWFSWAHYYNIFAAYCGHIAFWLISRIFIYGRFVILRTLPNYLCCKFPNVILTYMYRYKYNVYVIKHVGKRSNFMIFFYHGCKEIHGYFASYLCICLCISIKQMFPCVWCFNLCIDLMTYIWKLVTVPYVYNDFISAISARIYLNNMHALLFKKLITIKTKPIKLKMIISIYL